MHDPTGVLYILEGLLRRGLYVQFSPKMRFLSAVSTPQGAGENTRILLRAARNHGQFGISNMPESFLVLNMLWNSSFKEIFFHAFPLSSCFFVGHFQTTPDINFETNLKFQKWQNLQQNVTHHKMLKTSFYPLSFWILGIIAVAFKKVCIFSKTTLRKLITWPLL